MTETRIYEMAKEVFYVLGLEPSFGWGPGGER